MRVALMAALLVSAGAFLWVGWGPIPEGRLGGRILLARARLRPSSVDEQYKLAERFYDVGDFEKSELQCQKVLQMNPSHAPSRALFTEVSFILGKGKATPSSRDYDFYRSYQPRPCQQVSVEIDNALAAAERHRAMGEREAALREVRKVLEFAKWMPQGIELQARREKAEFLKTLLTEP